MNIFRSDLLTLLISLFAFTACQKTNLIGLKTATQDAANSATTDLITVETKTVLDNEPIFTGALTKYPYGILTDPLLGTTTSNLLMSLNLPSNNVTFGTSPSFVSADLVLTYADEYYGDPAAVFTFEVHQLTERILSTSNQNSNNTTNSAGSTSNTIIGSTTGTIVLTDTDKTIRIPIDPSFINPNFLNAQVENFVDNEAFNNWIRGLYLKATRPTGPQGGIVFFNLGISGGSKLELKYTNSGSAVVNTVAFPIQSAANPVVAAFSHDFTNATQVNLQLGGPPNDFEYTFVQPLAGLRTQVNFPDITPLTSLGKVVINKAELVITPEMGLVSTPFTPAARLYFYYADVNGNRKFVPDHDSSDLRSLSDGNFGGFYKGDGDKKYRFIITSYIQDLVNGKLTQNNAYLAVADAAAIRDALVPSKGPKFSSATTAQRVVIGSGKAGAPSQMKLNIIYNIIK